MFLGKSIYMAAKDKKENIRKFKALEDKLDVLLAKEALAEHGDADFIPWEEIKKQYGLK